MVTATKRQLSAAAEQAIAHWDLDVVGMGLANRSENAVFKVDCAGGDSYALRLHRPGYNSLAELNSEIVWADALSAAGIRVPKHKMTIHGSGYATVVLGDTNQPVRAGLIEWVDGQSLGTLINQAEPEQILDQFLRLGVTIANIHNQADGWCAPHGFERRRWDEDGLIGSEPLWGRFWEAPQLKPEERELLLAARETLYAQLRSYGKPEHEFGLVHADLHPYNVLVDGTRIQVIDFDDCGFSWHVYEIAVALYNYRREERFDAMTAALIAGYRQQRALSDEALALLPTFFLIRSLIGLGWINGRPELIDQHHVLEQAAETCQSVRQFLE